MRALLLLWATVPVGCAPATPIPAGAPPPTAAVSSDTLTPYPDAVRAELLAMGESDQAVREPLSKLGSMLGPGATPDSAKLAAIAARMDSVDRANTARLKEIIRQHGWPSKPRAGNEAAQAAWAIVQHATFDLPFQKRYLAFLEREFRAGRASGGAYALLTDRTRLAEGKPQLYGSQARIEDGKLVFEPIEDPEHVDERRAALGMPPLAEYRKVLEEAYGVGH